MARRHSDASSKSAILSRLNRHFASCAVIATGAAVFGFSKTASAQIVYSGPLNITLAISSDRADNGSTIGLNLATGAVSTSTLANGYASLGASQPTIELILDKGWINAAQNPDGSYTFYNVNNRPWSPSLYLETVETVQQNTPIPEYIVSESAQFIVGSFNYGEKIGSGVTIDSSAGGLTVGDSGASTWSGTGHGGDFGVTDSNPQFTILSSALGDGYTAYPIGGFAGGGTDEFVGFEIPDGESFDYGWMRLSVDGNADGSVNSVTLVDYAYQSTAGMGIVTGDTGAPVPEPGSAAMLGTLALGAIGARSRRRRAV